MPEAKPQPENQAQGSATQPTSASGDGPRRLRFTLDQLGPPVEQAQQEPAWHKERRERLRIFEQAVGPRYAGCSFANFQITCDEQRAVYRAISGYAAQLTDHLEQGRGVLLVGPSGTGKDHLLVALARFAIWHQGVRVLRLSGPELFRASREAMHTGTEARTLAPFQHCPVLLLSDPLPPVGGLTEYQAAVLYELVDYRYRRRLPVWCTLNCADSREAGERLTPAVLDRL